MTEDKEFAIRMEPQGKNPSGDEKYAIIGYFREKQRTQNMAVNHQAENVAPQSTTPASSQETPIKPVSRAGMSQAGNILANSTAEQWLLAFIAFLLFINLICRN